VTRRAWVLFAALCIIWGLPYLLIRIAVREVDPATLVFLRTAPVAILLLPWAAATGRVAPLRPKLWWVLAYTVCEFGVPWFFMSQAETRLNSSTTALLVAAVPIIAVVLYRFTGAHERLGARRALGLGLGALGVASLVGFDLGAGDRLGIAQMALVCLGYTLGPLIIHRRLSELSGPGVVGVSVTVVALAYAPWGLTHLPSHPSGSVVASVLLLALVPTLMGFLVFFALIVQAGPARATVVTYVNPAIALLLGVVILGEPLTAGLLLGFPMIIAGSILATGPTPPPLEPAA
jgi:drug/metabolite transporter (DMT)-like permease